MSWLWAGAVVVLFGMVGVAAWYDGAAWRVVNWCRWLVIRALNRGCSVTGHRWCHLAMPKAFELMDRWGFDKGDERAW